MSLAENLLEATYQNSRSVGIENEEEHIVVGKDRVITVPNKLKTIAVKGDKDIEKVTIDCVRYWDGHDLSSFAIYINYILANGDEGTYIPQIQTKLEDIFTFDWEIGSEVTYVSGDITFWIVAKLTDNDANLIKQWSSFQNSVCNIAQGGDKIYVPEKQTDQDVISQAISNSQSAAERAEKAATRVEQMKSKAFYDFLKLWHGGDENTFFAPWRERYPLGEEYDEEEGVYTQLGFLDTYIPNAVGNKEAIIILPPTMTKIDVFQDGSYEAYENQTYIKNIWIPSTVTEISDSAFMGCACAQMYGGNIVIPTSVKKIGDYAFCSEGWDNDEGWVIDLTEFVTEPFPTLGEEAFADNYIGPTIRVLASRVDELKAMTNWSSWEFYMVGV